MSSRNDERLEGLALLILRLGFGGLMAVQHGAGKLAKVLAGDMHFADPLGLGAGPSLVLAALAEGVCGALVALGLATRGALIPLAITMVVAVFVQHRADPMSDRELGSLYLAGYVALLLLGPGRYALSRLYAPRLSRRSRVVRWLLE